MKPILLKFKGINNFENEQAIDFKTLSSDGLFGIFGKTGSGKTTVLDAVTLALYGKVSRYKKIFSSEFININSTEAYVYFEFEIIDNGNPSTIVIERQFRKKENKSAAEPDAKYAVTTTHMVLYRKDPFENIQVLAEKNERDIAPALEEIIGLNYEDFLRTVILPQGKFSEFLHIGGVDRSRMLERIFMLDDYGEALEKKIKTQRDQSNLALLRIEDELKSYAGISEQTLADEKKALAETTNKLEALQSEEAKTSKALTIHSLLNSDYAEYLNNLQRLNALNAESEKMEEAHNKVLWAKKAMSIRYLFETQRSINEKLKETLTNLNIQAEILNTERAQLQTLQTEYDQASKRKQGEYLPLIERESQLKQGLDLNREIQEAKKLLNKAMAEYRAIEKSITVKLQQDLQMLKDSCIMPEREIAADKRRLQTELAKKEQLQKLVEANQQIERLEKSNLVAAIAKGLQQDEPCPVCGSVHHPRSATTVANEILNNIYSEQQALTIAVSKMYDKQSISNPEQLLSDTEMAVALARERIKNNTALLQQTTALIDKQTAETAETQKRLAKFAQGLHFDNLQGDVDFVDTAPNLEGSFEEKLTNISSELKALHTSLAEKRARLSGLCGDIPDLQRELLRVQQSIKEIVATEQNLFDRLQIARGKIQSSENIQAGLEKNHEAYLQMKAEAEQNVKSGLAEQGFADRQTFVLAYIDELEIQRIEKETEAYDNSLIQVKGLLQQLEYKLTGADKEQIKPMYEQFKSEYERIKKEIAQTSTFTGICQANILSISQRLERSKILQAEQKKATRKNDLLRQLDVLLSKKRFVKFVARRQLDTITSEASLWLADMSRGRYAIGLINDNFVVRDNFNGGAYRSTTSLSGGETFMVSLSLALALASKVQMKNKTPLEFFFLDEGFGTLDNSVLDTVMDCLDKLRADGMTVGLISHVEELKSRITKKLIIDSTAGSFGEALAYIE